MLNGPNRPEPSAKPAPLSPSAGRSPTRAPRSDPIDGSRPLVAPVLKRDAFLLRCVVSVDASSLSDSHVLEMMPVHPLVSQASKRPRGRRQRLQLNPPALWQGFKRLTQVGLPRRFPIVQFPNAPLIASFIAAQAAGQTHGAAHAYASAIAYLAFTIWAYEEFVHGVSWLRRLLGLGFAISTIVHVALALQS